MKTKLSHSVGLAALTYAGVLLSGYVVAEGRNLDESCVPNIIGDGHCDQSQNTETCAYDGGDCCACTCTSGPKYACTSSNFACVDPGASCLEDTDEGNLINTECVPDIMSDGGCDLSNNNEECGYDGGDCCHCTCVSANFACGTGSNGGFACRDPSAPCVEDDDVSTFTQLEALTSSTSYESTYSSSTSSTSYESTYSSSTSSTSYESTRSSSTSSTSYGPTHSSSTSSTSYGPTHSSSTSSTSYESTHSSSNCVSDFFADGDCDLFNNNEECGFDDGDCCECTCVSTEAFTCGDESNGGFDCVNPSAPCVDDDDDVTTFESSESNCVAAFFADGDCDIFNNNEFCGYDGGDCCLCTCESTLAFTCGDDSHGGFACIEPSATCVDDDEITINPSFEETTYFGSTSVDGCIPDYFSDGLCDFINNTPDCGYDGGDCCNCTCNSTPLFTCGNPQFGGFACIDPGATCVDDDDVTELPDDTTTFADYSETFGCNVGWESDGDCDSINNQKDCGFDGGDCCECTCEDTMSFTCGDPSHGGFNCINPDAPCVGEDDDVILLPTLYDDYTDTEMTTELGCVPEYFSDGICDDINNDEGCGFDGGDCCECTCMDSEFFTCADQVFLGFDCIDPNAAIPPCLVEDTDHPQCRLDLSSNGKCDLENNDEVCGFDGGDCCVCTCVSTEAFACGDEAFECVDPSASCFGENDDGIISLESDTDGAASSCLGDDMSNGVCDPDNNNEECGYDGGDCCECTCMSTSDVICGDDGGFDCIDPESSCSDILVDAGTKTSISVSTNTYDTRTGEASGDVGCGEHGCRPELTLDGSVGMESRWACAQSLNPGGGLCEIRFVFEDPQDIMEVQVAFYRGSERSRTLQAKINRVIVGEFDSNPVESFTTLGIQSVGVETMTFTTVGLIERDWISLLEVRFMVEP